MLFRPADVAQTTLDDIMTDIHDEVCYAAGQPVTHTHITHIGREWTRTLLAVLNGGPVDRKQDALVHYMTHPSFIVATTPEAWGGALYVASKVMRDRYLVRIHPRYYEEAYEHELSHFLMAKELGFPQPFMGYLFVGKHNPSDIQPFMGEGRIPETMSDDVYRNNMIAVAGAPDRLSKGDKEINSYRSPSQTPP